MTIQELISIWSKVTLRDQITQSKGSPLAIDAVLESAAAAKIRLFYPVTGRCSEDLLKSDVNPGNMGIQLEEKVQALLAAKSLSPGNFLVATAEEFLAQDKPRTLLPGLLARALVAFPSHLRTEDLYERLPAALSTKQSSFRHFQTSVLRNTDPAERADITITLSLSFRIWSYLNTEKSLRYTTRRVTGEQGNLSPGLHLTCPFSTKEGTSNCDWLLYSDEYIAKALEYMTKATPMAYPVFCREVVRDVGFLSAIHLFHV